MTSTSKIEKAAVREVATYISKSNYLDDAFETESTKPATDGEIRIYKKPGERKADFYGQVHCQVKGTEQERILKSKKYGIKIIDLNVYYEHGGAIFFVVYVVEDKRKIYYRDLLRIDIQAILEKNRAKWGDKKSGEITVDFKEAPEDINEFHQVIKYFYDSLDLQSKTYVELNTSSEIKNDSEAMFTVIIPNKNDLENIRSLVSPVVYKKEGHLKIPVGRIDAEDLKLIAYNQSTFFIGTEKTRKFIATRMKNKNETIIKIGSLDQFQIVTKNGQVNISFNPKGDFFEIRELLELAAVFINGGKIYIDEKIVETNGIETNDGDMKKGINDALAYFNLTCDIFEAQGISLDLRYDKLTKKDILGLDELLLFYQNPKDLIYGKFKVNNQTLHLIKYKVTIYNVLDTSRINGIDFAVENDNGDKYRSTPLILIEDFTELPYFEENKVIDEVKAMFPIEELACGDVNLISVRLIQAYDKSKEERFINCASQLLEIIKPVAKDKILLLIELNQYQIKKRFNKLSFLDIDYLISLKEKYKKDMRIYLAILILVGASEDANNLLKQLDAKGDFNKEDMPILNLL